MMLTAAALALSLAIESPAIPAAGARAQFGVSMVILPHRDFRSATQPSRRAGRPFHPVADRWWTAPSSIALTYE